MAKSVAAAIKGTKANRTAKRRSSVHFFRPKTVSKARVQSEVKVAVKTATDVLIAPRTSEAAMAAVEKANTLQFVVAGKATKTTIKAAVQSRYGVKCTAVRVHTVAGAKRALCRLDAGSDALDVANKIGII